MYRLLRHYRSTTTTTTTTTTAALLRRRWASTTATDAPTPSRNVTSGFFYYLKRQDHKGYLFNYLLWSIAGSMALHNLWTRMEVNEYREKQEHKIKVLRDIIQRFENGQELDDALREEIRMVLMGPQKQQQQQQQEEDMEYLETLIMNDVQSTSLPTDSSSSSTSSSSILPENTNNTATERRSLVV